MKELAAGGSGGGAALPAPAAAAADDGGEERGVNPEAQQRLGSLADKVGTAAAVLPLTCFGGAATRIVLGVPSA